MIRRLLAIAALCFLLGAPHLLAQMTQVTATVQDANNQHYVNCSWSVVFVGQNTIPGAGPYQPAALLVGQQGTCNSSGVLTVSLADNIATVRPTPSQWNFSICSAPGYIPGGTYCRSNMLVTITGASQNLTSFFQPLMPLLPSGGGGGGSQYITDATPLGGLMRTGSTLGLQTTCIAGQYLGWNGSAWACTTPGGGGVNSGTLVTVNGTQAVPNQLNFNSTSPLPPAGSQNVVFQLNGNSVSGYVPTGGGGGGSLTVNGATGGSDLNDILPPFPPNGINISWQAANGHISGAIVGDGIATHCFLGTGVFAQCPGSGASAGVSSINGLTGALSFTGAVSCSGSTCNFTGGGAGGLPTIPQYNLFASTGAGGAQDSAVKAGPPGFLQAEVITATGDITSAAAPFQLFPNAGVEYFPSGYAWSGGTSGATNGLAMYMSHSSGSTASANGGVALGGGNSSSTGNQVYLDCETSGCDFKVPVSYLGSGLGGGGGGSGTVAAGTGNYFAWYPSTGTTVNSNSNLSDNGALITSQEPLAAPGINVTGSGGIAMTGAGGTLPTPASGQGGIGIGPGNVPQFYSNGGAWTAIGSGGAAGVSSINGTTGAFTFGGAGVSCATTTCTFSGGTTLPTITANNIYVSNGSGGAQDSNVQAEPNVGGTGLGVIKSGASLVGGLIGGTSPFTGANGSQEWYGQNGVIGAITVPNGAVLFMGNSSLTTGAVGNGGVVLGGNSATTTSSKEVYLDCEHTGCDFKAQPTVNGSAIGGSGTVALNTSAVTQLAFYPGTWSASRYFGVGSVILDSSNNLQRCTTSGTSGASAPTWTTTTTTDGTVTWTYVGAGNSATVMPAGTSTTTGVAVSTTGAGINIGNGLLQFGGTLATADTSIGRVASTLLATGGGTSINLATFFKSGNSAALLADQSFTTSNQPIFNLGLPNAAQNWIVRCAVPITLTGSGAATLAIGVQSTATPNGATTFSARYESGVGTPTFLHNTATVSASGITNVLSVSITDISVLTQAVTVYVDGILRTSGSTAFSITASTSNGTGAMKAGSYCRFD